MLQWDFWDEDDLLDVFSELYLDSPGELSICKVSSPILTLFEEMFDLEGLA